MSTFHIWDFSRTFVQVATHQVLKFLFIWVPKESRALAMEYSLLHFFIGEPLIVLSDRLEKHHSLLDCLHIRQPIIILYELCGGACLPIGHQIVPIITIISDMVTKLLEERYA